jgi:hypothetical protein
VRAAQRLHGSFIKKENEGRQEAQSIIGLFATINRGKQTGSMNAHLLQRLMNKIKGDGFWHNRDVILRLAQHLVIVVDDATEDIVAFLCANKKR